jgi:hypothetical protein
METRYIKQWGEPTQHKPFTRRHFSYLQKERYIAYLLFEKKMWLDFSCRMAFV